jgi:general secretion pathway protein E
MADRRVIVPETKETVYHLPTILQNATELKASDIHIEPGQTSFRIRIRIDGRMQISDEGPRMAANFPKIL